MSFSTISVQQDEEVRQSFNMNNCTVTNTTYGLPPLAHIASGSSTVHYTSHYYHSVDVNDNINLRFNFESVCPPDVSPVQSSVQQQHSGFSPTVSTGDGCKRKTRYNSGKSSPSDKKIVIDLKEMKKYYYYPQPTAAKLLGVSLSTLKRRYYEVVGDKRWPYPDMKRLLKKRNISYIVHDTDKPTKQLDPHTIHVLKKAFQHSCSIPAQQRQQTMGPNNNNEQER